ncbi:MAG: helix-turn-helix transcriptional regulator [Bacteroidota bacterium]
MDRGRTEIGEQIARIAALEEPLRRELYFLVGPDGEVSRDQAARALRISRALAAFHLDKLVEAGILEASFRRLSGRSGPGAGRPSKVYRRADRSVEVALPERRYVLAGRLLLRALAGGGSRGNREALLRSARQWGERLGAEARERAGKRTGRARLLELAIEALRESGFEPRRDRSGTIVLANCPFHALAAEAPGLVCGMNQALIGGLIAGLDLPRARAELDPAPGRCCVVISGTTP